MIEESSCNANWIDAKAKEFRSDPIIVEKVIRALILLESIQKLNLKFIFKGGTALMLMVPEPRRFSIDIDIIIEDKKQDIELILDEVVKSTSFTHWKEHRRVAKSTIKKVHYKLFYKPETKQSGDENNILLDIVFEKNPYNNTKVTEVSHFLASEKGESEKVITPTLHAILGDKLTAYGPDTTGVPLTKPKEVLKQIYDINNIFDKIDSLEGVRENFLKVAEGELIYKGFKPTDFQLIIDDIIKHSYNFCSYGKVDEDVYKTMQSGVSNLKSFIYGEKFREPQAQIAVAKASYIVKQIERESTVIDRYNRKTDMSSWRISDSNYSALNKLKKHNLEAFHYWYKTLEN
jgi:hypothetical protein